MEENKNKENQERVKIYDKEMYISQEKFRTIILIILVFVVGFIAGYFSKDFISENTNTTYNTNIIRKKLEIFFLIWYNIKRWRIILVTTSYYEGGAKNPLKGRTMKFLVRARNASFVCEQGVKKLGGYVMAYINLP